MSLIKHKKNISINSNITDKSLIIRYSLQTKQKNVFLFFSYTLNKVAKEVSTCIYSDKFDDLGNLKNLLLQRNYCG